MKVIIEVKDGKVVGVYSDEEGRAEVFYDIKTSEMSDSELDKLDDIVSSVPYVLYNGNTQV